jgi:hypothetical protein
MPLTLTRFLVSSSCPCKKYRHPLKEAGLKTDGLKASDSNYSLIFTPVLKDSFTNGVMMLSLGR